MNMSNKTYDTLKWIAQYLLPAAGTLYFALAGIWGLPYGEQVLCHSCVVRYRRDCKLYFGKEG